MAKVSFNKLALTKNTDKKTITINDIDIEIKQYLPVDEKLELISYVINMAHDENFNFSNPVKVEVFAVLGILKYYTNISLTEKQLSEPAKIYDLLSGNNIINKIIMAIPLNEYTELKNGIEETIKSIYQYQNSVLGILDTIGQDYSNLDLNAADIQKKLSDPNDLKFLKDVLTKLG